MMIDDERVRVYVHPNGNKTGTCAGAHAPSHVNPEAPRICSAQHVFRQYCLARLENTYGVWMHQDCFGSSQMLALKQARDPVG